MCLFDLPEEQRSARKLLHLPVSQGGGRSTRSKWSKVEELGDHRHTPHTHTTFRVAIWRWGCLTRGLRKILICHVRQSGGGRDVGFGRLGWLLRVWFCGDGGRRRGVSVDSREEIGSVNVCGGGGDKEMSKRSDREGAFLQFLFSQTVFNSAPPSLCLQICPSLFHLLLQVDASSSLSLSTHHSCAGRSRRSCRTPLQPSPQPLFLSTQQEDLAIVELTLLHLQVLAHLHP